MMYFCVIVRWLDARYHGRRADGQPEWPPSPLRLFQAMVAAACRHGQMGDAARSALEWLQAQESPGIVAPPAQTGHAFTRFVPNNDSDAQFDRQGRLTPKAVRPTLLLTPSPIHYLWPVPDPLGDVARNHVATLRDVARSIVALGWGVDTAVGLGAMLSVGEADALPGERWLPASTTTEDGLRVPVQGSLQKLMQRYQSFLERLEGEGFTAPMPLSGYVTIDYRRATEGRAGPVAAFSLLEPDSSGFRAFDTVRRALTIAGMMRGATRVAAARAGRSERWINEFVLGHGETPGASGHVPVGPRRFAYLPLPSIETRGQGSARVAGSVRRAMLTAFADDCDGEIAWARRHLCGQELIDEDNSVPVAVLSPLPSNEKVVRHYTDHAPSWATVTPVVLPGYDDPSQHRRRLNQRIDPEERTRLMDRLSRRIDRLLRRAITQAGFAAVLAAHADLDWRKVGFWPGTDRAERYGVPDHLRHFPRFHVRLQWRDTHGAPVEIPGPICLGAGRFCGLGLFAAL